MAGGLGDPEALFPWGEGLGELSQVSQDRRQDITGDDRRQRRHPEALTGRRALYEGDHGALGVSRTAQVAGVPERQAQNVVRDNAQPEVADRLGDRARALPRFDRPSVLAEVALEMRVDYPSTRPSRSWSPDAAASARASLRTWSSRANSPSTVGRAAARSTGR